jgi:hypothetical protein
MRFFGVKRKKATGMPLLSVSTTMMMKHMTYLLQTLNVPSMSMKRLCPYRQAKSRCSGVLIPIIHRFSTVSGS